LVIWNVEFGNGLQVPLLQVPAVPQMGALQSAPCLGAALHVQNPSMSQTGDLHGRQSGMEVAGQVAAMLPNDQRHVTTLAVTVSFDRQAPFEMSDTRMSPRSNVQRSTER
jgi:hypothetical protein